MRVPIIMPQLGESIAEATVIRVGVGTGDQVSADQEIIEVETNKALMQVTTPCAGEVVEVLAAARQTYAVGAILGYVELRRRSNASGSSRAEVTRATRFSGMWRKTALPPTAMHPSASWPRRV
jgi:pyruvate/2-oxoglutarate dehydrogenase complex dihydrolipoamide acyltransferase (E2) component